MWIESAGRWGSGWLAAFLVVALCACDRSPPAGDVAAAEAFIDAFYSWDRDSLASRVLPGTDADAVLYYQAWAEAAHYEVKRRLPCWELSRGEVSCAITVTDDFGAALGYTATDTFTLTVVDGMVAAVTFEGDDPPVFQAVFQWLAETRPDVFDGPCRDLFAGGETPGDCARAVAQGARDYAAQGPE